MIGVYLIIVNYGKLDSVMIMEKGLWFYFNDILMENNVLFVDEIYYEPNLEDNVIESYRKLKVLNYDEHEASEYILFDGNMTAPIEVLIIFERVLKIFDDNNIEDFRSILSNYSVSFNFTFGENKERKLRIRNEILEYFNIINSELK